MLETNCRCKALQELQHFEIQMNTPRRSLYQPSENCHAYATNSQNTFKGVPELFICSLVLQGNSTQHKLTGTGCPERQWRPHPWKHSRPGWTGLWATWSTYRCPCSLWGGQTRWPPGVPSDPKLSMILWSWHLEVSHASSEAPSHVAFSDISSVGTGSHRRGTQTAPDKRHLLQFSLHLETQLICVLHDSEGKNTFQHYAECYLANWSVINTNLFWWINLIYICVFAYKPFLDYVS